MEANITIFITADLNLSNCYLWTPYRELCCYLDMGTVIEPFSCRILLTFRSKCVLRLTTIIYGIAKFELNLKDWVQRDRKNISWFAMVYDLHLIGCVFNPQVKGLGMKNSKNPKSSEILNLFATTFFGNVPETNWLSAINFCNKVVNNLKYKYQRYLRTGFRRKVFATLMLSWKKSYTNKNIA